MENTLDISMTLPAGVQARTEGPKVTRPSQSIEGAVAEERPNDQRVGKLEQLQKVVDEAFADTNAKLSISYDEPSGRFIYKELDPETGEVVREYPPQEVLERIARIRQMTGVSLDRDL
jgi:flagellar protein FlaG